MVSRVIVKPSAASRSLKPAPSNAQRWISGAMLSALKCGLKNNRMGPRKSSKYIASMDIQSAKRRHASDGAAASCAGERLGWLDCVPSPVCNGFASL